VEGAGLVGVDTAREGDPVREQLAYDRQRQRRQLFGQP
jgi:hypothetical protein